MTVFFCGLTVFLALVCVLTVCPKNIATCCFVTVVGSWKVVKPQPNHTPLAKTISHKPHSHTQHTTHHKPSQAESNRTERTEPNRTTPSHATPKEARPKQARPFPVQGDCGRCQRLARRSPSDPVGKRLRQRVRAGHGRANSCRSGWDKLVRYRSTMAIRGFRFFLPRMQCRCCCCSCCQCHRLLLQQQQGQRSTCRCCGGGCGGLPLVPHLLQFLLTQLPLTLLLPLPLLLPLALVPLPPLPLTLFAPLLR